MSTKNHLIQNKIHFINSRYCSNIPITYHKYIIVHTTSIKHTSRVSKQDLDRVLTTLQSAISPWMAQVFQKRKEVRFYFPIYLHIIMHLLKHLHPRPVSQIESTVMESRLDSLDLKKSAPFFAPN